MLKKRFGEILARHTSFRIGGKAYCFVEPYNVDEIIEAVVWAEKINKKLIVIGNGSNVLASDGDVDAVIMKLGKGFDFIEAQDKGFIKAGSIVPLPRFVNGCAKLGLKGCEFLSGIPGSVGGAVYMNAGVRDLNSPNMRQEIKDIVARIEVLDIKDRQVKLIDKDDISFSYRRSGLEDKYILSTVFKLEKSDKHAVLNRIESFMKKRSWINRLEFPSAGSVFKNPDREEPAGILIEKCSLKGKRIGGAEISKIHGNVIVNVGGAGSKDVMALIELARSSVKDKFGVELELEIKVI